MSFSSQTKEALSRKRLRTDTEARALLCAVTAAIGTITLRRGRGMGVKYTTESHQAAKLISKCAQKLYSVESELSVHETLLGKQSRVTVLTLYGSDTERILIDSGLLSSDACDPPKFDEKAARIYLRGAFLSCGSVTDPEKSYHLEMVCRNEAASDIISKYADIFGIAVKRTKRKDNDIVYLKDSESIIRFLSVIGADDAVLQLEGTLVLKDRINHANRTYNCDLANIDKSRTASIHQIDEIRFLLANYTGELPARLKETAEARLNNPEATLSQLSEILSIGKSGVNHRLQKLLEMARSLRNGG